MLINKQLCKGSEQIMTVLGAVVFGGFLALGVLWLLVTASGGEVDQAWAEPSFGAPDGVTDSRVLTQSSYS
ncbi:hypothetical protein GCM10009641_40220 [Mycobacterium cookii]|uniref:Uncharacterized protein n=2 Tax=Mycobacterium cookii TaxID=1775 RepID=A0A7I7KXL4_9MYCO|nr:hypothetical protein MCOO_28400 [Mycobacterium cookii]